MGNDEELERIVKAALDQLFPADIWQPVFDQMTEEEIAAYIIAISRGKMH